jgi:hypothetical protein
MEVEYIAAGEATCESLWLRQQLLDRGRAMAAATVIFCDNNGALTLACDPIHHSRNKHIDVCHHFIWEKVEGHNIDIWRIPSANNVANILTKPLGCVLFEKHRLSLGVWSSAQGGV